MGFMDKIKDVGQNVAEQTKKATAQGKEKLGDIQAKKKMDGAAEKIGYLIYREKTEGTPAGSELDTLVEEMKSLQAQIDENGAAAAAASDAPSSPTETPTAPPAEQPTASEPSSGDFKL
jgi:hypothetical protein